MESFNTHYIKKYEPFWGTWYLEDFAGEGSYGKVYRISKRELDFKFESALKIISISGKENITTGKNPNGTEIDDDTKKFHGMMNHIMNEIKMMYSLRGYSNIISYEDHMVKVNEDNTGCDILIRMEYAKTLSTLCSEIKMEHIDVIKLGIDICSALEVCEKNQIVHRDVKDDNIFVSQDGNYKLGDFGIAEKFLCKNENQPEKEKLPGRGTPLFLAPEAFNSGRQDNRSDIYSLGIVLYKLLNKGWFPFVTEAIDDMEFGNWKSALVKRLSGEMPPMPIEASDRFGSIILRACSFHADDRFSSASMMKKELIKLLESGSEDEWFIDLGNGEISIGNGKR